MRVKEDPLKSSLINLSIVLGLIFVSSAIFLKNLLGFRQIFTRIALIIFLERLERGLPLL